MDVRLYQTDNGGDIDFVAGQAVMSDGLETLAYLSLFGGNERDSGLAADHSQQFWGNFVEEDPDARYRSRTQALLRSLPIIPASLQHLEDAAVEDLAWMIPSIASAVSADASMPGIGQVKLSVSITVDGKKYPFDFLKRPK